MGRIWLVFFSKNKLVFTFFIMSCRRFYNGKRQTRYRLVLCTYTGMHWTQKTTAMRHEHPNRLSIIDHIAMRCHLFTTRRSRKSPIDNLAIDMPRAANVWPIISHLIACTALSCSRSSIDSPKPYGRATWTNAV